MGTTAAFYLGLVWGGLLEETKTVTFWKNNRGGKITAVSGEMSQSHRERKKKKKKSCAISQCREECNESTSLGNR